MITKFKNYSITTDKKRAVVLGDRQRRLLSDTAHIEDELIPDFVRPLVQLVAVAVMLFFLWAGLTHITEVARALGEVITIGKPKVVQHVDGGIIKEIMVEEHSLVHEGQELLRFDGSQAMANLNQAETRLVALKLRAERLSAFAEGRKPDFAPLADSHDDLLADQQALYHTQVDTRDSTLSILDRQIDQQRRRIAQHKELLEASVGQQNLTGELSSMRENLAARHLVTRIVLLETRRAKVTADGEVARIRQDIGVAQQSLAELEDRRVDTLNQLRREAQNEMGTVTAEIAEVEETMANLKSKVDRLVVRAPHRGYVLEQKVLTVGQVIQPGALLMQIVPDDVPLEAEIRIQPKDIGYVRVGQRVNLRVSSYDYARFGFATGTLRRVSVSSTLDEVSKPYYRGWVALDRPYVGKIPGRNMLQSGMGVEAEVITGKKTLLSYLSKPVIDVVTRSFHER
ncbi:MAG: HlyD family type I secretion periplasmic adaptor subunit [Methylobacter sp.]|nr:MAG: HlyD family type I secretion periplasmic adaptor subunit [Methylobacter sp.]